MQWYYTTIVDFIDHWQTLLAGLIVLIAAIITVFVTLRVERRRVDREVDTLRKSLVIEPRQLIPRALGAHASLHNLGSKADGPITARIVESQSQTPVPIVYPANAHKIGHLEADAIDVSSFMACSTLRAMTWPGSQRPTGRWTTSAQRSS